MKRLKKIILLLIFMSVCSNCGIKGPPLPPLDTLPPQANSPVEEPQEQAPVATDKQESKTKKTNQKK